MAVKDGKALVPCHVFLHGDSILHPRPIILRKSKALLAVAAAPILWQADPLLVPHAIAIAQIAHGCRVQITADSVDGKIERRPQAANKPDVISISLRSNLFEDSSRLLHL